MIKLKWINENPSAAPDERGYWRSIEGRFVISPNYRHTIYPDSYTVIDRLKLLIAETFDDKEKRIELKGRAEAMHDTVRDCKGWATDVVARELEEGN